MVKYTKSILLNANVFDIQYHRQATKQKVSREILFKHTGKNGGGGKNIIGVGDY